MTYWSGALDTGDETYSILVNEKEKVIVVPLWPPGGGFVRCNCGALMEDVIEREGAWCCPWCGNPIPDEIVKAVFDR